MRYNLFGLIGYPLGHSFSPKYFTQKFWDLGLEHRFGYEAFALPSLETHFRPWLERHRSHLRGFNVTIPYKQNIISFLDELSPEAQSLQAVNTVLVRGKKLIGYNTDAPAFAHSLKHCQTQNQIPHFQQALVLGNGGAAQAVKWVLKQAQIPYKTLSRYPHQGDYTYVLPPDNLALFDLLVQTTPLGMYPQIETKPMLNYDQIKPQTVCLDLIYNPETTKFMQACSVQGARAYNGLLMLHTQADLAWEIWKTESVF